MLFIECPIYGGDLATGINVPKEIDPKGFSGNQIYCPECKTMHTWDGKDAYFLEEEKERNNKK